MIVPSMYDLPKVMAESSYTEEQVFDLGIGGEILFLVVVPLIGACRVPVDALSHFMAGADDYTADGMLEHYTGALSGLWKIKRDRLRILPESWEQYSDKAFELVDVQERADHSTEPLPIGFYRLRDAAEKIAKQFGWPDDATDTLISQWVNDAHDGSLTVRHPKTYIPCLPYTSGVYGEFLTAADVNAWAEKRGVLWRWSVESAPAQTVATPAPAVAVGASLTHSTRARRDTLTPVIELAQSKCRNPKDTAEVWAVLLVLAEKKQPPLIGVTEEGLQYYEAGEAAIFKRKSLGARLTR